MTTAVRAPNEIETIVKQESQEKCIQSISFFLPPKRRSRQLNSLPYNYSVEKGRRKNLHIAHQHLSGSKCCTNADCLHRGHSGYTSDQHNPTSYHWGSINTLLRHHSLMQLQQNTCPQPVAVGSFILSRQSVHFLPESPLINLITFSSSRSYFGPLRP